MNLEDFFEAMSYPFEEMTDFESKKYMYRQLVDHNMKMEKVDLKKINFTQKHHILQLYWFKEGMNDEEAWEFIYYIAACCYTGFDYEILYK